MTFRDGLCLRKKQPELYSSISNKLPVISVPQGYAKVGEFFWIYDHNHLDCATEMMTSFRTKAPYPEDHLSCETHNCVYDEKTQCGAVRLVAFLKLPPVPIPAPGRDNCVNCPACQAVRYANQVTRERAVVAAAAAGTAEAVAASSTKQVVG